MNSSVIRATCPRQSVVPLPYSSSPWRRGGGEGEGEEEEKEGEGEEEYVAHVLLFFMQILYCKQKPFTKPGKRMLSYNTLPE